MIAGKEEGRRQEQSPDHPVETEPAAEHSSPQRFTSHGAIPEVSTHETEPGPSASDRAYSAGQKLRVTADALNVRATPGKAKGNVLGGLHQGEVIEAEGQEGAWIRIAYHGQQAYVNAGFVAEDKPHGEQPAPDKAAVAVAAQHIDAAAKQHATAAIDHHDDSTHKPAEHAATPSASASAAQHAATTSDHAPAGGEHAAGGGEHGATAASASASPAPAPAAPAPAPAQPAPEHHATPSAPTAAPGPDAKAVHAEYDKVLAEYRAGKIDQSEAVKRFTTFEGVHQHGALTPLALELLGQLLGAMAGGVSAQVTQATHAASPAPTTPAPTTPAAAPASPASAAAPGHTYLSKYTSLGGTNVETLQTTQHEAEILNAVRASDKRFDPAWLASAQTSLGVAATGAFNTETLRKLMALHPNLDADTITQNRGNVLTNLAQGTPFIETDAGFTGEKHKEVGPTKADRAAQRLGYASYKAYSDKFEAASFLGVPLNSGQGSGLAHPHLIGRLQVAEKFLRHQHPGMADKDIVKAIGWNGSGNAAYADDVKYGVSHFHTMGLAIDIDVSHNPYVFTGRQNIGKNDTDDVKKAKTNNNWWMDMFERQLANAAKIFGGEPISAATMDAWASRWSTDELYARVHEVSASFGKYLDLAKQPKEKIVAAFEQAGIGNRAETADQLKEIQGCPHYFHDFYSRDQAKSLTNHSQQLLVALRDVAGLSWGGAEMSSNENGDFMHFDCRKDSFGRVLQNFNFP